MISAIIAFSTRNKAIVALLTLMLVGAGVYSVFHIRLDAIPDLSDVQVIVTAEYEGQNPEVVDDQVTYPLTTAMLAVPGSTAVRGYSMFGMSFVYVLFEDGTDMSWARSRVLESLSYARDRLPRGVQPTLGPDATGVGWVYQYALFPGWYCTDHPRGVWHDPDEDIWHATHAAAPEKRRPHLVRARGFEEPGACPIDGKPLTPAGLDLAEMRSLQDWYLRYPLTAVEGVSEVASIGGFVKQYQVVVDPEKLAARGISLMQVSEAIQRSNRDVGGSVLELSENEVLVRSRAYLNGTADIEAIPLMRGVGNNPVTIRDVAHVQIGGEARRGVGELDGKGEVAGGIVIARFGSNSFEVIGKVKEKIHALEDGLPPGVFVKETYDRSKLIQRSIDTLVHTLLEEILVVGLVCILFLLHARSELVAVFVVPASLLLSVLTTYLLGIEANIMSLGGLAISIGVVVDSSIIMVENGHKHLDREEERVAAGHAPRPRATVIAEAAKEVGPQLFFSLAILTVSFVPVFALGGEAGRLFHPLAYTKTFAMAASALLAITIIPVFMILFITTRVLPERWSAGKSTVVILLAMFVPAVMLYVVARRGASTEEYAWWFAGGWALLAGMLLVPQKIVHENKSPLSLLLQWLYEPVFRAAMKHRAVVILVALVTLASAWYPISKLGTEFMPALDEGDLLYMPTTDPSVSVGKSRELLQVTDKIIASFPEVISVHGKIGRAETATDPAPLSMLETVVQLEPDRELWRKRTVTRFFSNWPRWIASPLESIWPLARPITTDELRSGWTDADGTVHTGLNEAVSLPGMANAWPYPIENRINMLATGIKTPVGIKVMGPDLEQLGKLSERAADIVRSVSGTTSAYPERTTGGRYLDIDIDRAQAARYGLTTGDVQDAVETAIGGMVVTTTVEGPERYGVQVRYARELRDDIPALADVRVDVMGGGTIPLGQVASFVLRPGPPMIRSENAQRTAWVFVDVAGRDLGGYVKEAQERVARELELPAGYTVVFSGQYEFLQKAIPRLILASIATLLVIVVLLYAASRSWFRVAVVLLALPFSIVGAAWFLWALDYNMSLAVAIGVIALAGLDAETGLVMLFYLDDSYARFVREGRMKSATDLIAAVHDGAVKRIRPKAMTVSATFVGLLPLLWATGTGADVMRRLAAPLLGGLTLSFAMELIVYPVIFQIWKSRTLPRAGALQDQGQVVHFADSNSPSGPGSPLSS
ncbi:MAG: efflux RND transporter permease subunit [Planctomycetes bacterium]|nr:efflux RND transporter permease subunit [Planctomycetota bacterium]